MLPYSGSREALMEGIPSGQRRISWGEQRNAKRRLRPAIQSPSHFKPHSR
jgi:hypothetical protein